MAQGEPTGAEFIDVRKAFNTIDCGHLLSKLPCCGTNGRELTWFESYLFKREQFVPYDSAQSARQTVFTGVLQGSVLGPLLFVLLINNIDLQLEV